MKVLGIFALTVVILVVQVMLSFGIGWLFGWGVEVLFFDAAPSWYGQPLRIWCAIAFAALSLFPRGGNDASE